MIDFEDIEVGDGIVMHDKHGLVRNLIVEEIDDEEKWFWDMFDGIERTIWAIDGDGQDFEIIKRDEQSFLQISRNGVLI